MSEMQRYLIGSVKRGQTKAGKPIVELYAADSRLQFPVLTLFDLSMLETIGIDPNDLGNEPVYKRCWAFYVESDKTNAQGNAYKDVQYLESLDTPATTTSTDTSALLAELRAIRGLLQVIAASEGLDVPAVNIGDTDENADWIASPDRRAEEAAIHDELARQYRETNGDELPETPDLDEEFGPRPEPVVTNGEVPANAQDLMAYVNGRNGGAECTSVGHLLYGIKKVKGDNWGWPVTTDQAGWKAAAAAWLEYAADL
jgi:hypothetical protein